jgi:hypothetical protein
MKAFNPLTYLARTDKWYLGGGGRLLWAPPVPLFLDRPGFWDKAHYYNLELQPLFSWVLLDGKGKEVALHSTDRSWNPARLTQRFKASLPNMTITEEKSVLPIDTAISTITITNRGRTSTKLHLVAWTTQSTFPSKKLSWLADAAYRGGIIEYENHRITGDANAFRFSTCFGVNRQVKSHSIALSEGAPPPPQWTLTPFFEQFAARHLDNNVKLSGVTDDGLLHMALHTELTVRPGKKDSVTVASAFASSLHEARQNLNFVLETPEPVQLSNMNWNDHLSSVPSFQCSDEFLSRYYWYRWYGLKLNTIATGEENYGYSFVCEGIGYFRAPISYSAMCHMLENRWMHSPDLARGSMLTFIDNQRDDGGFRGYIDVNYYRQEMFYHANWGNAVAAVDSVHPSIEFLQQTYEGLKRYASYFDRERDEEVSGLYDIDNHYETGQEFMHRYTAVNPDADKDNWGEVFRLKGVDVTVYIYELKRALSAIALRLGKQEESDLWEIEAGRIKEAVLNRMWDPEGEMFFDVNPATGEQTRVKAAVCFYPYFTDIVSEQHLAGLKKHLFNRDEFWTRYPVPSSSADDPFYSPLPEWKGKRMNCPWNGRVWPMTNSHIAEALAGSALRFNDGALRKRTAEFITRFIRMMFLDGDPQRPNCFEHYNPETGQPCIYRGIDDYQHSWVNDLIIKYVCGIRPGQRGIVIDPFPFGLKSARLTDVFIRGMNLTVEIRGKKFVITIDGQKAGESRIGTPVFLEY